VCFHSSGFGQLAEVLSFASPKESTQRKGDHSSLACGSPRGDVILRVGLIRLPCLKQALLEHPVLVTRKITPPLGSSEGDLGAAQELRLRCGFLLGSDAFNLDVCW